ncbi:MAG TPA: HprK-related kinase B [bacterium]|nr:HprK-related kinase B [bacterium]
MSELAAILRAYRPDASLALEITGVSLRVHTNAPAVRERLGRYFAAYAVEDPGPGASDVFLFSGTPVYDPSRMSDVPRRSRADTVKEAFYDAPDARIVLKRRTGVVIYVAEPFHYIVGDLEANFNQAVNMIMMVFAKTLLRRGYIMLHASAILGETGGIAFASPSGSGKSTLALMLLEQRHHLVSNDRLLLRPMPGGVEMIGVPKQPRVNPGTLLRVPSLTRLLPADEVTRYRPLPPEQLWVLEHKHDVDVDAIYGPGTVQLRGRLRAVFLLRWSINSRGWSVHTVPPGERVAALSRVVKGLGVYDVAPPSAEARDRTLAAACETVSVYEVSGRADLDRLAALVLEHPMLSPAAGAP